MAATVVEGLAWPPPRAIPPPQRVMSSSEQLGRYVLERRIATGGMAEIWLARQDGPAGFAKDIVIKRILPHLADDEKFVEMFLDEARLAAQLSHPNIVQIFDLGEAEGSYFIAMEFIDGVDLSDVIERASSLQHAVPPAVAARIVADVCMALDYAHTFKNREGEALNLVHRDISPQNVLLTRTGVTKVVDFGVAKAANRQHKTQTGAVKGKLSYMSPEQISGKPIDGRSDIFALGIVLYELVTTQRPFGHESELLAITAILNEQPPAPRTVVDGVPVELEDVIFKALAKDPDERYASAREMQRALEKVLQDGGALLSGRDLEEYLSDLFSDAPTHRVGQVALVMPTDVSADISSRFRGSVTTPDHPSAQTRPAAQVEPATQPDERPATRAALRGNLASSSPAAVDDTEQKRRGGVVIAAIVALVLVAGAAFAIGGMGGGSGESGEETAPTALAALADDAPHDVTSGSGEAPVPTLGAGASPLGEDAALPQGPGGETPEPTGERLPDQGAGDNEPSEDAETDAGGAPDAAAAARPEVASAPDAGEAPRADAASNAGPSGDAPDGEREGGVEEEALALAAPDAETERADEPPAADPPAENDVREERSPTGYLPANRDGHVQIIGVSGGRHTVFIDGRRVGTLPGTTRFSVPSGSHRVRVESANGDAFEQTVNVRGGQTQRVRVRY